jgi:hypothetical protein
MAGQACFNGLSLYNPEALSLCDFAAPSAAATLAAASDRRQQQRGFDDDESGGSGQPEGQATNPAGASNGCESPDALFHACLAGSGFGRVFMDPLLTVHRTADVAAHGARHRAFPLDRACIQLDDPTGAALPPSF